MNLEQTMNKYQLTVLGFSNLSLILSNGLKIDTKVGLVSNTHEMRYQEENDSVTGK